ncbi:hypothetical protein GIB67_019545 [Kingdonia uniflora]|uniref:Uncharacterized protein n=1 Tax=Kingdonia uniflora TaxID=39325 RepID=A0A7J7N0A2_9MAGN|nr:hypothetical protein GIB67_019545 [Kingdonia uniflora]
MMTVVSSLSLFNDLRVCGNRKCTKNKSGVGRNRFSFHYSQLDALSINLLGSVKRPICSISSSRCDVFICRSFLTPGGANEIPFVKTAVISLTRTYNALCGKLLVQKLVSALGIIVFTVCGLGPLLRHFRKLFLHGNDSNWKKSRTNYIMTSYLQPLLLYAGALLMFRALDPLVLSSEASQAVKQRLLNFMRSLSTVLAFAYCLSSLIQQVHKFFMGMKDSNDTRDMGFQFAGKAIYTAMWVAAVSLFMELLGFSTHKWLTAGGLGTVLLTLAGREIFTNFLSSVMIHATRPFVLNEWIQTKIQGYEVSGTVEHVGWWSPTVIRGDDREAVHIPNHKFTVNVVRNLSQKTHWRIKTHLAISHLDVKKINNIVADMRKVLSKNSQIEQQRLHRRVFLDNIDPQSQAHLILVSCFVKTSHIEEYLCVKEAVLLDLLRVISHHRARLATPIRTIYNDTDIDPFAETIFRRTDSPTNKRPFILIEPPYKISGEDKTKPQSSSYIGVMETPSDSEDDDEGKGTAKSSSESFNSQLEGLDSMGLNSNDISLLGAAFERSAVTLSEPDGEKDGFEKSPAPVTTSESGSEKDSFQKSSLSSSELSGEKVSFLEDNIVLGVALDGSKRTLPIEEKDMLTTPPPTSGETKELATCRNGNGLSSVGKDTKESQISAVPVDQQDQER